AKRGDSLPDVVFGTRWPSFFKPCERRRYFAFSHRASRGKVRLIVRWASGALLFYLITVEYRGRAPSKYRSGRSWCAAGTIASYRDRRKERSGVEQGQDNR